MKTTTLTTADLIEQRAFLTGNPIELTATHAYLADGPVLWKAPLGGGS